MPSEPAVVTPTASPDPLRSLLDRVSKLAIRVQEWASFLTQLRTVATNIDGLTNYVHETGTGVPVTFSEDAWKASQRMWEQIEQNLLEDLREVLQSAQGITAASPLPKPGGDLAPKQVLDDLDAWLKEMRDASSNGSAPQLRGACKEAKKKLDKSIRVCFLQISFESQSLTTLVHQIENELNSRP